MLPPDLTDRDSGFYVPYLVGWFGAQCLLSIQLGIDLMIIEEPSLNGGT